MRMKIKMKCKDARYPNDHMMFIGELNEDNILDFNVGDVTGYSVSNGITSKFDADEDDDGIAFIEWIDSSDHEYKTNMYISKKKLIEGTVITRADLKSKDEAEERYAYEIISIKPD